MTINNGAQQTTTTSVTLQLFGGPDAHTMAISNDANLTGASQIPYASTIAWTLPGGVGQKTVYARFYTDHGMMSPIVSSTILLVSQTTGTTTNPSQPQTPTSSAPTGGTTAPATQTTGGGQTQGTPGGAQPSVTGGGQGAQTGGGTSAPSGQANVAGAAGAAGANGLFANILSTVGNPQAIAWIIGILILAGLAWWGIARLLKK
jgi:hypothetical protein